MADADPAMLAQMLDTGPDSTGVMPYLGGVLKGALWDPVKGAWSLAKRYGANAAASIENPSQADPFLPFHDLQAAGSGIHDKLQDTFGNGTDHFWDTVAGGAHDLKAGLTSSDPSAAGETLGSFIGPGEIAKGIGALSDVPKLGIWGGPKAATHNPEAAARALELKANGSVSDRAIWDSTRYWNPPENMGQSQPWHWINDSDAKLKPDALDRLHDRDGSLVLGDLVHPDWHAFTAYPGLAQLPVHMDPHAPSNAMGRYMTDGPNAGSMAITPSALAHPEQLLPTIVHEAAHAVQHFEGMPGGGSPDAMVHYGRGLSAALDDDSVAGMDLEHRQAVRDLAGKFQDASVNGPGSLSWNGYQNIHGEANARVAEHMLAQPRGGYDLRPFEQYGHVGALPDPSRHLVTGAGGMLMDPRLPPDGGLGQFGVTGNFRPTGPDLASALKQIREHLAPED